jgi:hypothetical protein
VSPDAIPIPSWQQGIATDANQASTVYRNAPDVAMEGDFDNYACSLGSCQGGWGGTSFASPRWAGYMALVNQAAAVQGENPIGFLNPLVYAIGQRPDYSQMFHDITVGSNGLYAGYGIPYFNAVSGYDLVTGWGSPTGEGLISLLAPSASSSFQLAFSPSSLTVDPGASAKTTVTVNSIGGFSSPVTLSANVLPPGVTIAFSQNTVTTSTCSSRQLPGSDHRNLRRTYGNNEYRGSGRRAGADDVDDKSSHMDRSRVRLLNRAGYVGPVGLYRNSDPHGYVGSAQWRDRCAQPEHPDCPQLFVAVKDHRCQLPDVRTRCFDTSFDQQYHGDGAGRRCVRHTERIPGGASTAVPFEYPTHGRQLPWATSETTPSLWL